MQPDRVVMLVLLLEQHLGFPECLEAFAVQQFVPQPAVERLIVAVLPRRAWLDAGHLHHNPWRSISGRSGGELAPIVQPNMAGRAAMREQVHRKNQNVIMIQTCGQSRSRDTPE